MTQTDFGPNPTFYERFNARVGNPTPSEAQRAISAGDSVQVYRWGESPAYLLGRVGKVKKVWRTRAKVSIVGDSGLRYDFTVPLSYLNKVKA